MVNATEPEELFGIDKSGNWILLAKVGGSFGLLFSIGVTNVSYTIFQLYKVLLKEI